MIEKRIPKEIKDYKEKWYFNLTLRQLICIAISLVINVPLFYFGKDVINSDLLGWFIIGITSIFALIGFFEYNGMTFEKFIICYMRYRNKDKIRTYKTENIFEKEMNTIVKITKKDKERK